MKQNFKMKVAVLAGLTLWGGVVMAGEEAKYDSVVSDGAFEVRLYAVQIVAQTLVEASREDAGNRAFRILFGYISGDNKAKSKIAMTSPVGLTEASGEKIAMTAPVGLRESQGKWAVSFMMPADYTLETLPAPTDVRVTLRQVPARHMAALRYSGRWTEARFLQAKAELDAWIAAKEYQAVGEAEWARYNPPFTLPFLRRNEVLIPIASP